MLKVIQDAKEETVLSKSTFPFCGAKKQTEEDNILFSDDTFNGGEITVYKCSACGKLDGYRILPCTFALNEVNEEDFDQKAVAVAQAEGHLIYSGTASVKIVRHLKKKKKTPWKYSGNISSL